MRFGRSSVVAFVVASLAVAAPALSAQNNQNRSRQDQQDIEAMVKIADAAAAGTAAPADIPVTWASNHFFRGAGDVVYIPYTLGIDARALSAPGVALYVRVIGKDTQPSAATAPANNRNNDRDRQAPMFPWERQYFVDVKGNATVGRPMQLKPGTYDVIVVAKERTPQRPARNAPPLKAGVLRHQLVVPDYFKPELMTSTIMLSAGVEPLTAPPTAAEQEANPYLLGGLRFSPLPDARTRKGAELQLAFFVYGVGQTGGKPDVLIDRTFFVKMGDAEKPFVKMAPEQLNAQTLPAQFDLNAGHQLSSIVDIPVKANFPEGDYRVEITITDRVNNKSIKENVSFSVIPD